MTKTILIVDDDQELQDLYAAMLAGSATEIVSAFDGLEALQKLEISTPEAIILDIILDEMMGDELLSRLRADSRWSRIPVVVVSVLGASAYQRILDIDSAAVFLRKPFSRGEFLAAVRSVLSASTTPAEPTA